MPRRTDPGRRISRLRQRGRETERVARAQQLRKPTEPEPPTGLLRRTFRDHTCLTTAIGGALAAVLTAAAFALATDLVDLPRSRDELRRGPDVSAVVRPVHLDDEGWSKATRAEYHPPPQISAMMSRPNAAVSPDFHEAIRKAGAIHVDTLTLRIVLTGRRNQQVNVVDIAPEIVERTEPWSGTLFSVPSQAGAPTMKMLFDMDRPHPVAREMDYDGKTGELGPGKAFFAQRTITLKDTKQQVVILRATTEHHYVAFRLKVTYMLGDQERTLVVDEAGRPFQLTAFKADEQRERPDYSRVFTLQQGYSLCQSVPPTRGCEP
ncbi:hypothetical protein [Streptomyces sp. NPDC002490]|uniref:hypothetical protein n=1 Tax=Streptomyces sp. NPDC002490 TaxID=3154416 RepID=UPI0033281335